MPTQQLVKHKMPENFPLLFESRLAQLGTAVLELYCASSEVLLLSTTCPLSMQEHLK